MKYSFGSDNHSGVHPKILKAIEKINSGYSFGYGEDKYTEGVLDKIEKLLGGDCKALFVLNGTGANVVSISTFLKPFSTILAPHTAHIIEDECGAVERFSGCRITPIECQKERGSYNGKISPASLKQYLKFGDQHKVQPKILSISQPTENETLYTIEEIKQLSKIMHQAGGYIHLDGSRISNAAAAMKLSIKEIVAETGIDSFSFGGTKNGLLIGEVIVVFNKKKNKEFIDNLCYIRKQATQLYSKNRFIAAQFEEYIKDNLYLKMAQHANKMATYLKRKIEAIPQIAITKKVETNAVYLALPFSKKDIKKLQDKYLFYMWDEEKNEARLMCSFNTTKESIDELIKDIRSLIK